MYDSVQLKLAEQRRNSELRKHLSNQSVSVTNSRELLEIAQFQSRGCFTGTSLTRARHGHPALVRSQTKQNRE
eukprot:1189287-Prorocentrum_minimum.AAC.2